MNGNNSLMLGLYRRLMTSFAHDHAQNRLTCGKDRLLPLSMTENRVALWEIQWIILVNLNDDQTVGDLTPLLPTFPH